MNTLVAPTYTLVDNIPLGRRIEELKKEKGGWYSTTAMASRLGMSSETLRPMLKGKREIYKYELEKIANDLKLPVERILQEDTAKQRQALDSILKGKERTKTLLQQAHVIASELVEMAMGASERGYALQNLGRVQYYQKRFDDAHHTWLRSLEYAKILYENFDDRRLLHLVSENLMLTYSIRQEFSNIQDLLTLVEEAFPDNYLSLGRVAYTRMQIQNGRGDYEAAKQHAYRSLELFEQAEDDRQIGHALINVAHFEYLLGNYSASTRSLSAAIKKVVLHEDILVLAVKDYVKSLVKVQENDTALRVIEQYEQVASQYPDYWAKLQIMKTVINNDPSFADRISNDAKVGLSVRYLACQCLFKFFADRDDYETAVKYYKKGEVYSSSQVEFYEKEEY